MEENNHRIGSWNGLTLRFDAASTAHGVHRHDFHMLRLQIRGTIITEWRSRTDSGVTLLEPGSLALFQANARHGGCSSRPRRPQEETEQIVALVTDSMLQEAAEAALLKAGSVHIQEKRVFRDLALEHMLCALRDAGGRGSAAGLLVGETLSSAIALHLIGNHTSGSAGKAHAGGVPGHNCDAFSSTLRAICNRTCRWRRLRRKRP